MHQHVWLVMGLGFATGCRGEFSIRDELPAPPVSNPVELEAPVQVDRILQVVEPRVDVLWVIDNSPSMVNDRESLARAFPEFIAPFETSAVDWHVGVITTDMQSLGHQGRLQERFGHRWIDASTPDFNRVFQFMTTESLGGGSSDEQGREAAWVAMDRERNGFNKGFFREEPSSYLHVTVVTDEDDDTDSQELSVQSFIDYIRWFKPYAERVSFNSIVALKTEGTLVRGDTYIEITEALGGIVHDITKAKWEGLMDDLGGLQAPEPFEEFFLSRVPVVNTLDVRVITGDGVTLVFQRDVDYAYNVSRNSIVFLGDPPAAGSLFEVRYTIRAVPEF